MFGKKKKDNLAKQEEIMANENVKVEQKEEVKYKYVSESNDYKVEQKATRNPLLGFKFWFLCIGAAVLLTVGIWIMVDKTLGEKLSIGVTGAIIFLLGLLRFIPLFKGTKNNKTKLSILGEILIELLIGGFLFVVAFLMQRDGPSSLSNFVASNYKYFLGVILYLKAVFYFINTSLLGEDTYKLEFWTHILCITLACAVFALNFNASSLALFVGILCLLSGVAVGLTGGGSYFKYHKYNKVKKAPKDKKKKSKKDNKDEEVIIVPQIDDDSDSAILQ